MANGMYLTIGLNSVDPTHYHGWDGKLRGCESDARDMATIATAAGCTGTTLLTGQATYANAVEALYEASSKLQSNDLFVLCYSGHGGQVGDVTADEDDRLDETWCLFDRQLIDDELFAMWSHFKPGVRIVVFSDSCHSGTVTKDNLINSFTESTLQFRNMREPGSMKALFSIPDTEVLPKALPFDKAWNIYIENRTLYDTAQRLAGPSKQAPIGASVMLISGCQDNQLSGDGANNGLFTGALKDVWANGTFKGNYEAFATAIGSVLPPSQSPNYYLVGANNLGFEAQSPFAL